MAVYKEAMPLSVAPRRGQLVSPAENQWTARLWWLKAIEEWAPTVILEFADTLHAEDQEEALSAALAARCMTEPWMIEHVRNALQRWQTIPDLLDRDEPEWPCYLIATAEWRDSSRPDTRAGRKEKRVREDVVDLQRQQAGWKKNAAIDRRWLRAAVEHKILGMMVEQIVDRMNDTDLEHNAVDKGINAVHRAAGLDKRKHPRGLNKPRHDD